MSFHAWLALIALGILLWAGAAPAALRQKNVLILNSYHHGFKWSDEQTQGFIDSLSANGELKFYVEYMGTKWAYDPAYLEQLPATYRLKFGKIPFDLILATDDDALDFLLKHRDQVFGRIPVVFCGVNWFSAQRLSGKALYTGVNEDADLAANLDLMLKLHPGVKRIYLVVDLTTTGRIVRQKIDQLLPRYRDRVAIRILDDLEMPRNLATVGALPDDSLVFLTIFQRDKAGAFFEYSETARLLSRNSRVPVYGLWDFYLGHGIVGGLLTSGEAQGRSAGALARRILAGASPDSLPVVMRSPNRYLFDHEQLQRFGIRRGDLPSGSRIVNAPDSFLREHKLALAVVSLFICVLMLAVILLSINIGRRKRVEAELKKAEQRLSDIVDFLPVATFVIDKKGRVMAWNKAIEKMSGVKAEDMIGKGNYEYALPFYGERRAVLIDLVLLPREEQGKFLSQWYASTTQEGDLLTGDAAVPAMKGEPRFLFGWAHPFYDARGEVIGAIECISDVTDKKQAEELRFARDVAQGANRAKSVFLANMSHEIRTPLNAILGFSQIMAKDRSLTRQQREYLDTINRSGEHLLDLINDILEISKIEAGRSVLNQKDFDLRSLIRDLESMLKAKAEEKGLSLSTEISDQVPRLVHGDQGKLRQIYLNLLSNAVKFTQRGAVSLRVSALELDGGVRLVSEVRDTGIGIAPEEHERLFKYFEQTSSGIRSGAGTGLGLAISRQYAVMMGGDITVESEIGRGSVFCCSVDLATGSGDGVPPGRKPKVVGMPPGAGAPMVLVVDDSRENRALLVHMLREVGFRTQEAEDGTSALEKFAVCRPDLVLMDIRMPRMDGFQATRLIRERESGARTPIIAVTASTLDRDREEVLATGVDGFIGKPFREPELFEAIGRVLRIDYLYEEEIRDPVTPKGAADLEPGAIAALPPLAVEELRRAVLRADFERMLELVDSIETENARTGAVLREMVSRYEYEALLTVLPP